MRRELKILNFQVETLNSCGFSSCPDEEGTEKDLHQGGLRYGLRFSSCPDEEGTENLPVRLGYHVVLRFQQLSR